MILNKKKVGYYSGVVVLFFSPAILMIAFLMEPTYNPFLQTISKLGITPNGELVFVFGMAIAGSLLILFNYFYLLNFVPLDKNLLYSSSSGIISGIALIGVGLIQDKSDLFHEIFHTSSAFVFFLFMGLSILFCGLYFKNASKNNSDKRMFYISCFIVFISLMYAISGIFDQPIELGSIEFSVSVIWQKITVFSFFIWFIPFYLFGTNKLEENIQKLSS